MSDGTRQVSRSKHFRAWLGRQTRGRGKDTIAITILTVVAITMTLWIFTQQKAALPSWTPFVGEDFVSVTADFSSAQSITAGQGQAVTIAGIRVGKVGSVDVEDGHAVVGLDIQPEYLEVIRTDATLLPRPKPTLHDMVIEVDPGSAPEHIEEGFNFPLAQTEPNVGFEGFLSSLDTDTQRYVQLLVAGGAQGLNGRGRQLGNAFRRFQPFSHVVADLNRAVAERRRELARVIHNFGLLTTELGRRDTQIERWVTSSGDVLGNFANVQASIQESLVEFPPMLLALQDGLESSTRFTEAARPALTKLIPQARAFGPAFRAQERLFEQTLVPIRDQIRPFTRQIRPFLNPTAEGADDFKEAVTGFGESLAGFNTFFNLLAYKPQGSRESFLFYVPWLNHNVNASFNLTDAGGPIQRAALLISCNGSVLARGATEIQPYLKTIVQSARVPLPNEIPTVPPHPNSGVPGCGPDS